MAACSFVDGRSSSLTGTDLEKPGAGVSSTAIMMPRALPDIFTISKSGSFVDRLTYRKAPFWLGRSPFKEGLGNKDSVAVAIADDLGENEVERTPPAYNGNTSNSIEMLQNLRSAGQGLYKENDLNTARERATNGKGEHERLKNCSNLEWVSTYSSMALCAPPSSRRTSSEHPGAKCWTVVRSVA